MYNRFPPVDGALRRKVKELRASAIAVSNACDRCIASRAKGAAIHGATAEELAEALSAALLMNGGPAAL
ncbi:MAG: carboxymuconolactone decarboxylase family protein [Acidimicrobiales bacterium]